MLADLVLLARYEWVEYLEGVCIEEDLKKVKFDEVENKTFEANALNSI